MSASNNPWFHIVRTFEEIQELCRKAEEAEQRAEEALKTRQEASKTSSLTLPPATNVTGADIVVLREALRSRLITLRAKLAEWLTEPETFYAAFPLTIFADERARSATQRRVDEWPPLQRQLLEFDDGGVRFYSQIDALLARPETLPLIFQVFYLCLEAGFMGQYRTAPARVAEYKARLAEKIPKTEPATWDDSKGEEPERVAFPMRYYVLAAASVAGGFLLLHLASIIEALSAG
nr:type IV /VI secretion system protein [Archangium sp.]